MAKKITKAEGLRGYLDELIDDLRKNLEPAFSLGDVDAIHDARVATRRLAAAVDLFESQLSAKSARRFRRSLKKIRRTLGPLRDLDVMLSHLAKVPRSYTDAIAFLRHAFGEKRDQLLDESRDTDTAKILSQLGNWWGLRDEVHQHDAKTLLRNSLSRQLDEFCVQADGHAIGGEVVLDRNPHELRIAGKALRYTLELATHDGLAVDSSVMRSFKKMQDLLGLWHDYVVMDENILKISLEQQLGYRNGKLARLLLKLASLVNRRAEHLLQRFVMLWRQEGEGLRKKIGALVTPVSVEPVPEIKPDTMSETT
jgi:CHAD domain-containing protein